MSQLNVSEMGGTPQTVGQVNVSTGHTLEIEGTLKFAHRGAHRVPTGTTAERPSVSNSKVGQIRFNTTTASFEVYNNSTWISVGVAGSAGNTTGNYSTPARNGREIKQAGRPSGYYWIQPIGYEEPTYCYVDCDNYDGGWVCVMTAGSSSTNHYGIFEADNLYSQTIDGVTAQYVPVSGNYYSSTNGRKYADTFIRDVCSKANGGEETINVRLAKNNTQPPGGVYDTYNGGTVANDEWNYASFIKYRGGIQYHSALNTGGDGRQGDRREGNFRVSHVYPYNWEQPGGWENIRLYDNNYKIFDYHSNPSGNQTSRYSNNRVLWGYTGTASAGIYGAGPASGQGHPGYFFVR